MYHRPARLEVHFRGSVGEDTMEDDVAVREEGWDGLMRIGGGLD